MNRTFATTTLAVAVLSMTACKGGAGDSVKLIPDSATAIGGVDVKGVMASKLYTDNKEMLEKGGKEGMELAKKCKVGPDTWKTVVIGADPSKGEGAVVAVITADGIGKKETVDCLAKEAGDKATVEEDGKVIKMDDDGVAYVINDNTVAIAGKDWAAAVKDLRDGKGKNAADGSLKDLIGRTDTGKHVWFAGKVPAEMAGQAAPLGFTPKDVSGWLDLSSGLSVQVAVGADDAGKVAGDLQKQFDAMKGMAAGMVPQGVVDSVKIGDSSGAVTVEASISEADLKGLTEKAAGML